MVASDSSSCGRVVALWRYPVKSMIGEELNATPVGAKGLLGDRIFSIADMNWMSRAIFSDLSTLMEMATTGLSSVRLRTLTIC